MLFFWLLCHVLCVLLYMCLAGSVFVFVSVRVFVLVLVLVACLHVLLVCLRLSCLGYSVDILYTIVQALVYVLGWAFVIRKSNQV